MLRRSLCFFARPKTTAPRAQWSFEYSKGWAPIQSSASTRLLDQLRASNPPPTAAQVTMSGTSYTVDFVAMTQKNNQTGRVRRLQVVDVAPPASPTAASVIKTRAPRSPRSPRSPIAPRAPKPRRVISKLDDVIAAAKTGDVASLQTAIANGAPIKESFDDLGNSPAYYAARYGHHACLEELLKAGHQPDVNVLGDTAAFHAAYYGHVECLKVIERHGGRATFNVANGTRPLPLLAAAGRGHLECVKYLCDNGADVAADMNGITAVTTAATSGSAECLEYLLSKEPSLATKPMPSGETPLSVAVTGGSSECVTLLCRHGADPNSKVRIGRKTVSIKQLAAAVGSAECLLALLRANPNAFHVKLLSNDLRRFPAATPPLPYALNCHPLVLAAVGNNPRLVRYLLRKRGPSISTAVVRHAVFAAAHHGALECLEAIAARRPLATRNNGKRAKEIALAQNNPDCAKLFTDRWGL